MNICALIGKFRPEVAYRVMTECTGMLKKLRLNSLLDKLVENRMINDDEKDEVRPGSQYLASQPEVNVNARANARIELGSILAFVVRLH